MALQRIQNNDAYIGYGKQSGGWGTPNAPTFFPYWLDGSEWGEDFKTQSEMQGDTGVWHSLSYKSEQHGAAKIVQYLRPRNLGALLQAVLGAGSDSYTAPTNSTTLSAIVNAGASSFSVAATLGSTGTVALNFTPSLAGSSYETAVVDLTTITGTGPFTYSLAAGAKFLMGHASGDAVTTASNHSFTRQLTGYAPYTLEYGWGQKSGGGLTQIWQLQDAVCTDLKISGEVGKPLRCESTWVGVLAKLMAAQTTPVYEGRNVVGQAGGPFMFYQGGTSWSVDGSTSGNAATVSKFDLSIKNTTDLNDFHTEAINPQFFSPGNIEVSLGLDVVFQSFAQYNEMYYGAQTITTGASMSYLVGYGSFGATWLADALNSFGINLARGAYTAPAKLTPRLDGKSMRQSLQVTAEASGGVTQPLTLSLANSQNSAY